MSLPLRFLPEPEHDVAAAFRWYEARRLGLGQEFLDRLDATFQHILRHPLLPRKVHGDVRRGFMQRFPYGVHYVVTREAIVVLAVFHGRRDPTAWRCRRPSGGQENT